jgi:uncharacterized membrane protein YhaH (DUF805 family)
MKMKLKKDKTFYWASAAWYLVMVMMFIMILVHFDDKPSLFKTIILILSPLNLILAMINLTMLRRMYD